MIEVNELDLLAMCDVVDSAIESSDQLDFEKALAMKNAAVVLQGRLKTLLGLLETQQMKLLDGQPRVVGGSIFAKKATGKYRPNQSKLKSRAFTFVQYNPETGEKRKGLTIAKAVDSTIDLMYSLFVSPSQLPKQGGLDKMGMKQSDFCDWETTGSELVEMKLEDDHA